MLYSPFCLYYTVIRIDMTRQFKCVVLPFPADKKHEKLAQSYLVLYLVCLKFTSEGSMYCFPNDKMTEIRNRLILLSNSANIISKMTAFVAVDKEAGKQVEGKVVKRQCPIPVATKEFSKAFSDDNWEVDDCCMSRYFRVS